jgi:molybdate transport system regulatory protein
MKGHRPGKLTGLLPQFKLWLSSEKGEGTFGDGKWRLLEAIDRKGSLKAGADLLAISYRKAWGDLKKAEQCLGVQLIERHRGGIGGGQTFLTTAGKRWLTAYTYFRTQVEKATKEAFQLHLKGISK